LNKDMTQTKREYLFGGEFAKERSRLAGIEALWDPGSRSLLADLRLGSGWRCLEVGAGGGSLVEWMVQRGAMVTAVDIDTRFIEHLASDAVDVRRIDICTDELPDGEFDLVHARLVLEHLTDRKQILGRLAATLRPGGWIVIEDYDWTCFGWDPQEPSLDATTQAIMGFMERAGYERDYGRRVVADIAEAGCTDLHGEGRARIIDASSPGFDFFKLSIESLRQRVVEAGVLTAADADAAAARLADKDIRVLTPMLMAGIGRRP
jgi:SAM-dependent methyltransferase